MSRISKHIDCDICGTLTETKLNEIKVFRYGKVFQVADAVTETCPNCGEIYVPAETFKKAEKQIDAKLVVA